MSEVGLEALGLTHDDHLPVEVAAAVGVEGVEGGLHGARLDAGQLALHQRHELLLLLDLAEGESVIKYKFPLNVLKDTYDHSCH